MAKILIIDDRPLNRQFLVTLLSYQKHELREASDGAQGLRIAREQHPDLIISDVLMPTMDGYDFVRHLRAEPGIDKTPVIFSTAHYLSRESQALAEKCGVTSIIYKPCEPQTVLNTVAAALGGSAQAEPHALVEPEEFDRDHQQLLTNKLAEKTDQLRDVNSKLTALIELSTDLARERDPVELLDRYCSVAREVIGARWTMVVLLDRKGKTARHLGVVGLDLEDTPHLRAELLQTGIFKTLTKTGRAICLSDVTSTSEELRLPKSLPRAMSLLATPLQIRDDIDGWICLGDKLGMDAFSEQDEQLALALAAKMAVAYDNACLYSDSLNHATRLEAEVSQRAKIQQQLSESKVRLAGIIDSAMDSIITIDSNQRVVMFNAAAEQMFGCTASEIIGKSLDRFIPARFRPNHGKDIARFGETGVSTRAMSAARPINALRADGQEFPVEASISQIEVGGQKLYTVIMRDITDRKRAEQALKASESEMQALFSSMTDVILVLDAQGRHLKIAPSKTTHLYKPAAERIGRTVHEIFPKESADLFLATIQKVLADRRTHRLEYSLVIADKERWYDASISPMSERSVVWVARDISERKQAAEELARLMTEIEKQRERLDSLVSSVPGVVWEAWGQPDAASQRIDFVSDYVETMLGYSVDEWLSTPNFWLTIIHPDDKEYAARQAAESFASGSNSTLEFRWIAKDGHAVWAESNYVVVKDQEGRPAGLRGVSTNITERKSAEAELTFQKSLLESQSEASIDGILVISREREILSYNQRFVDLWGVQENALKSRSDQTALQSVIDKLANPKEFLEGIEYLYAHPEENSYEEIKLRDGRTIDRYSAPFKSAAREYYGRIWFFRDVTERKQLEDQLRQSQKLEAIGQLAGGIAHDFNNLLTAINGYSSLALKRTRADDTVNSYLEEIKKAGDRAANLTRQLLAFGRKQMLQPVVLNLNDVVGDMNKMLGRLIGEDIELIAKLDPALGRIKADLGQIEQVLVNLVVNSRDAMPTGGHLTIETANVELDSEYAAKHVGVRAGSYVILVVSDTGCGMDAETKARIFEPFFSTKQKGKGTGLGLSTVYGIVKQSGGNTWVYSEPGQGTTFKVYLPQVESAAEPSTQPTVEVPALGGSETILLVEDEDVVRGLARKILEEAGYRVLETSGGQEAIHLCQEQAESIDLLLTDVVMPETSGREIADYLTSLHPTTAVLFMSGYTDEAIVHHGIVDAGVEFIEKPFSPMALTKRVREVLDLKGRRKVIGHA